MVANVDRRMVDLKNFTASICGAISGHYNYVAEQETSGLCLQWVRDHLALDEIGVYLRGNKTHDVLENNDLYDLMNEKVAQIAPGSGGGVFLLPGSMEIAPPGRIPLPGACFLILG